jgi:hypothetical protein
MAFSQKNASHRKERNKKRRRRRKRTKRRTKCALCSGLGCSSVS